MCVCVCVCGGGGCLAALKGGAGPHTNNTHVFVKIFNPTQWAHNEFFLKYILYISGPLDSNFATVLVFSDHHLCLYENLSLLFLLLLLHMVKQL